jgi:hypothetical protein
MDPINFFEKNGYVILVDALTKERCKELTEHMFNLQKSGKLFKDDQCPVSDAVYGDPVFDKILQDFAEPIGKQVGKKLLPTYTYARIYRPGEVLKKHVDRPACEISATLTLGYEGPSCWPIIFDEVKCIPITLEPGEMAVYKGCDVAHWRTEFKGTWHVQVFFHYVDADGPHKNEYKDRRQDFGIDKTSSKSNVPNVVDQQDTRKVITNLDPNQKFAKPIMRGVIIPSGEERAPGYCVFDSNMLPELTFTKEECKKITDLAKNFYPINASIGGTDESSRVQTLIRSAEIYTLDYDDDNAWIHQKVAQIVSVANKLHFDYEISGIYHGIQLIHYKSQDEIPGHYDWHVDIGDGNAATRKISFTAQLSDPNEYEGCELLINNYGNNVTGTKEQGSIHMFPSFMLHKVAPITKGERFALVIWIHGSRRFR